MVTDLSSAKDVLFEIFDPDQGVREKFQNAVAVDAQMFAEAFAPAFALFVRFQALAKGTNVQRALVVALVHGVLDDTLTSVKLLLSGKLSASGNLARQAAEGICMAIMTAYPSELNFKGGRFHYWRLIVDDSSLAEGHRAPHQLLANEAAFGLAPGAAEQLKSNVAIHHASSHAGRLAMAGRMDLKGAMIYFGGHFDEHKIEAYRLELRNRVTLCNWAIEVMQELRPHVERLPLE
jgi:hypothetical protein